MLYKTLKHNTDIRCYCYHSYDSSLQEQVLSIGNLNRAELFLYTFPREVLCLICKTVNNS